MTNKSTFFCPSSTYILNIIEHERTISKISYKLNGTKIFLLKIKSKKAWIIVPGLQI